VRLLRENAGELSVLRFTSERPRRVRESRLSWCECEPRPLSGGCGTGSSLWGKLRKQPRPVGNHACRGAGPQVLLSFGGMSSEPEHRGNSAACHVHSETRRPPVLQFLSRSAQTGPQPWSLLRGLSQPSCLLHRCGACVSVRRRKSQLRSQAPSTPYAQATRPTDDLSLPQFRHSRRVYDFGRMPSLRPPQLPSVRGGWRQRVVFLSHSSLGGRKATRRNAGTLRSTSTNQPLSTSVPKPPALTGRVGTGSTLSRL
jgi:hypothetical protein